MKTITTFSLLMFGLLLGTAFTAQAQDKAERASPPKEASATVGGNEVTITYSAPQKKGRNVFGELVAYDKVWRTGANEAATISFSKDAKVGGKAVKAGKYGLFTIPGEKEWTIILNEVWDQWGAYNYDESKDVVRFTTKAQKMRGITEDFTIKVGKDGQVSMMWDDTSVSFKVE